ncbi:MAG: hypothetical protein ACHQ50_08665 [Fimbriimonadales bacterium]
MFALGKLGFYNAPAKVVAAAEGLMPVKERRVATLLRSTVSWSGARAVAEDFQLVVGQGENQTRLMYSRSGSGWLVLGRMPSSEWLAVKGETTLDSDEQGRFSFTASDLFATDVTLLGPSVEIYVPSAEELLSSGPQERD